MTHISTRSVCLGLALALGCGHTEAFAPPPREALGPREARFPTRLTFNPGTDTGPSTVGDTIVFSREDPSRPDHDRCLSLLPVAGGTLLATACARGVVSDTVRDAWLAPVVSPDRQRVAYVRERGRVGAVPDERAIVVAPLGAPEQATVLTTVGFTAPNGERVTHVRKLFWRGAGSLWLLAGRELFDAGLNVPVFEALGIFSVSLATADAPPTVVASTGAPLALTLEGSELWLIPADDPTSVYRLPLEGGPRTWVTRFGELPGDPSILVRIIDLAVTDGVPVILGAFQAPAEPGALLPPLSWQIRSRNVLDGRDETVLWVDGRALSLASMPGRRVVADVEAPAGTNLWLLRVP